MPSPRVTITPKRRLQLYAGIRGPLLDLRIELQRRGLGAGDDYLVAQVEHAIWARVKTALGVDDGDD